jgi:hypothetical protein
MKKPDFTPLEALRLAQANDGCIHHGFKLVLDGPTMTPVSEMAPMAIDVDDPDNVWFISGEPGDEITDKDYWGKP